MARAKATTIAQNKQLMTIASCLALAAGWLYSLWPLESYLNPAVAAHHGIASELGALGQPYNGLPNSLDIASGLGVVVIARVLLRTVRPKYL